MAPRSAATDHEREGKHVLREALDALAALSGRSAAEAAGVGYASLHAQGTLERANIPSPETLRAVADYIDAGAAELRRLARQLRTRANAVERERARA